MFKNPEVGRNLTSSEAQKGSRWQGVGISLGNSDVRDIKTSRSYHGLKNSTKEFRFYCWSDGELRGFKSDNFIHLIENFNSAILPYQDLNLPWCLGSCSACSVYFLNLLN